MKEMKKLRRKSLRKMIKRKPVSLTRGLVPEYECFNVCSNAWGFYVKTSLRSLITTGKGRPNQKEKADG